MQLSLYSIKTKYVHYSQATSNSHAHISGSRLSIQHSYTELQITLTVQ